MSESAQKIFPVSIETLMLLYSLL